MYIVSHSPPPPLKGGGGRKGLFSASTGAATGRGGLFSQAAKEKALAQDPLVECFIHATERPAKELEDNGMGQFVCRVGDECDKPGKADWSAFTGPSKNKFHYVNVAQQSLSERGNTIGEESLGALPLPMIRKAGTAGPGAKNLAMGATIGAPPSGLGGPMAPPTTFQLEKPEKINPLNVAFSGGKRMDDVEMRRLGQA